MVVNLENARYKMYIFRSQPIKILHGKGADRPLQHEVYFHELKILALRDYLFNISPFMAQLTINAHNYNTTNTLKLS